MATFLENNTYNTGWKFYKQYYDLSAGTTIKNINNSICNTVLLEIPALLPDLNLKFDVVTTYPGLLIGTGYTHEKKNDEDAFKIGFFFDYTSGMPIIPGSSVKGLLRSAFPQRVIIPKKVTTNQIEKENWIKEILKNKCGITEDVDVDELEREIFDGARKKLDSKNPGQMIVKPVPVYERDVFFDAVPVDITANNIGGNRKQLLGSDYITPHKNKDGNAELDPFSNPTPLKFLKIMPKVKIEFRFKLENSAVIPALDAGNKRKLFEEIIKTLGAGAKTNVGYGQFEEGFDDIAENEPRPVVRTNKTEPAPYNGRIRQGEKLEAIVIDSTNKKVKVVIGGNEMIIPMSGICPENGAVVLVTINVVNNRQVILQVGFRQRL